jgi:hypothetical protein
MNIRYNVVLQRFEAEFSTDFNGDLSAVKTAGFKTDGPPGWCWWTQKIAVLNKLRANKPISGLTITPEALATYGPLAEAEAKNDAIRKQAADAKKALKKKLDKERKESETAPFVPEGKEWVEAADLPPLPPYVSSYVLPSPPDLLCSVCAQPVYFYEKQDPPTCLWCEKESERKDLTNLPN